MLNFNKKGIPIARIDGGPNNKKILFLDTSAGGNTAQFIKSDKEPNYMTKPVCEYCKKSFYGPKELKIHQGKSCKIKQFKEFNEFLQNKNNIKNGEDDNNEDIFEIEEIQPDNKETGQELIISDDGKLIPLPRKDKREILYIAGPQDSGKSYYMAQYLNEFNKIFKKRDIILFSRIDYDKAIEEDFKIKNLKRIELDDELLEDPISLNELKNSCCVFDDIENSQDKEMQKYLENLRNDVIQNGRDHENEDNKDQIYVICTNHQASDYQKTRDLLNECTSITLFPQAGSTYGITRVLKHYCGLGQKEIDKILKLPSRWITIYKRYPMYCIYQKGCFLLSKSNV